MTIEQKLLGEISEPMRPIRLRKVWALWHQWLGLTVGLLLALSGVTGTLLVFRPSLDERLNPDIFAISSGTTRCNLTDILEAARECPVARTGTISFVDFPRTPESVWTVWFQTGTRESPQLTKVYLDPVNARVTGHRVHGADLMTWIYHLHVELLAGQTGETIVGLAGVVLMMLVISGLLLWWPLWKHSWRAAFSIRRGPRLTRDLHKTAGVLSGLLLFVLALTGVYLAFPAWIAPGVRFLMTGSGQPASKPVSTPPGVRGDQLSAGEALSIVQEQFPEAEIRRIHPPSTPRGTYVVRFCLPGDVHRSLGSSRVWIDQYSGELLQVRNARRQSAADRVLSWQLPLHNGEAFGMPGRWLVFITGLMPLLLYGTGFQIWCRRKLRSRRQYRRDPAPSVRKNSEEKPRAETVIAGE